ncbi:hypothetical protein PILCRDRAFT_811978 [Piloderma croceum F 1598]|uniref:Prolyl 4-hydroxylase alpha subunit Fe(2+) 2OG dioxygenase domain-containing protein n=1 Tax=Piloderma croceum (strain F 1598) TaxID=765440 RepID=A0A0C3G1T2_PILCF|nr:hypothetical protein PILCRDRAFT_811978 [Piloderma croceum F 1598]
MPASSIAASTKKALKDALTRPPYCSGTCPIPADDLVLYYGQNENARYIDFSKATGPQLELLSQACDPATFGVDTKDVLDESYRKAGKIDVANFATKFNIARTGLVELIRSELLEGEGARKGINVELYKLNVYGKDSFFKPHKDTPRGPDMFGSLVVVFPTTHEGGALILRHGKKEWTFDSAKEIFEQSQLSIGYIAFYSDVEHEVALVKSGFRVTLTYNLYFSHDANPSMVVPVNSAARANESAFKDALSDLLENETVLPNGGTLGFGLHHEYPVNLNTKLDDLVDRLKGSDAIIKRVCSQLSLNILLKVMYKGDSYSDITHIMTDRFADLSQADEVESVWQSLSYMYGGVAAYIAGTKRPEGVGYTYNRTPAEVKPVEIYWATPLTKVTSLKKEFIAYGNQAELSYLYGSVFIVALVGPPGHRTEL